MPPSHTGRLLLTPADPWLGVDPYLLRATLETLGFIGQPLAAEAELCGAITQSPPPSQGFLVGERFFNLLAFAGCAVNLRLSPTSAGEPFTHVHLVGPLASPLLLLGGNTRPPRCPTCRAPNKALTLFPDQIPDQDPGQELTLDPGRQIPCPACGSHHPLWAWDWKGSAGCGRSFVWVEEVFPGEAEPTPTFQAALTSLTASPWRHFYTQDRYNH